MHAKFDDIYQSFLIKILIIYSQLYMFSIIYSQLYMFCHILITKKSKCIFQIEQLYIEVLYTIANTVGASTGQYAHYKEDLYRYAQEAFGIPPDQHRRYLNIASEEKVCQFIDFTF